MNIHDWAMRWGIPAQAISELWTMPLPGYGIDATG